MDKSTIDNLSSLTYNLYIKSYDKKQKNHKNDNRNEIKNTVTIPDWLKHCQTPFSWHLEQEKGLGAELVILGTLETLDELSIEEPEFSLDRFVCLLKLILEYYLIGNIEKCCEYMKITDGCLEEEISRNDTLYQKVKLTLGHVVTSTKAQILFIIGKEEDSKKIGQCIIPIEIMADADKAALSSMKARYFLHSGHENGEAVGVEWAKKALELEPDNSEWEYILAKMLRKKRRKVHFSSEVPRDELKLLESAVKRDRNPKYIAYLAQVYRECAKQALNQYRNHPNFHTELQPLMDNMATKALEYYKEALSLSPDSPGILRIVGYGIMNLPKKFADYDLALKCLLQSLEISENRMILHILGTFYRRYGNDNRKALEYFEKSTKPGSIFGLNDTIRLKWILNHDYDPTPDFEIGLSWKLKKKDHNQLLAHLGGFHFFVRRDFCKSIEYFKQILIEDKDCSYLNSFKSYFLCMREPIDLLKYLANEALLLIKRQNTSNIVGSKMLGEEEAASQSTANVGYLEEFLELISEMRPELMEITPDTGLVSRLIQASKAMEDRYRGRGSHRGNMGIGQQDNLRIGQFSYGNQWERGAGGYGQRDGGGRGDESRGDYTRGDHKNWRQSNQLERGAGGYGQRDGGGRGDESRGDYTRGDHKNWRQSNQLERGAGGYGQRDGGGRGDESRGGYTRGDHKNWRQSNQLERGAGGYGQRDGGGRGDESRGGYTRGDYENWRKSNGK